MVFKRKLSNQEILTAYFENANKILNLYLPSEERKAEWDQIIATAPHNVQELIEQHDIKYDSVIFSDCEPSGWYLEYFEITNSVGGTTLLGGVMPMAELGKIYGIKSSNLVHRFLLSQLV